MSSHATSVLFSRQIYKYFVQQRGTRYYVYNQNGSKIYSGTSFETALVDNAIANLTAGRTVKEFVYVEGSSVSVDAKLVIPDYTGLKLRGKYTLANGVNDDMFEGDDALNGNPWVSIEGDGWETVLDGNAANQTAGQIFDFGTSAAADPAGLKIGGFTINAPYQHGVDVQGYVESEIYGLRQTNVDNGFGVYAILYDSVIHDCLPLAGGQTSTTEGSLYYAGTSSKIVNMYLNEQVYIPWARRLTFANNLIDVDSDNHGMIFHTEVVDSNFSNLIFEHGGNGDVLHDAINIESAGAGVESARNRFCNITSIQGYGAGTRNWRYTIYEGDADNIGQYCNIYGNENATGTLYLLNAVSKVQHQNIIGTVTEA